MAGVTMMTDVFFAYNEELDAELITWAGGGTYGLATMYRGFRRLPCKRIVQMVMRKLLEILFQSGSSVIRHDPYLLDRI